MTPHEHDDGLRSEGLQRYHALNRSFGAPFVLHLSRRGFFSEVNVAIDAITRGLVDRRRLIITQHRFNDLRWCDAFASNLPDADAAEIELVPPDCQAHRAKSESFLALLNWTKEQSRSGTQLRIEELGLGGDLFEVKRSIYSLFCRPNATVATEVRQQMEANGLHDKQFSAVHIRRGDKIAVQYRRGRPWSEGEDTSAAHCADMVHRWAPGMRDVFVLTDDYRAVQDFRAAAPGFRVVTLCPPHATGHDQSTFNAGRPEEKWATIRRLLVEANIASRSQFFAGGFKSNIPKFIASVHFDPSRCVSTDSKITPWPY